MREIMVDRNKIKAVFILQKFVRMSRQLLPVYVELTTKNSLTENEQRKFKKIDDVYSKFEASSEVGERLINSPIIGIIKAIIKDSKNYNYIQLFNDYQSFIIESDLLISRWNKQILN
jgi:hypothetical protein